MTTWRGGKAAGWRLNVLRTGWLVLWVLAGVTLGAAAQEDARLWLGEPDVSAFPLVRVPLHTADFQGAPISDFSKLSLRENAIPLDFEVTAVPTGIDVIFVVDANADFTTVDDTGGLTRQEKVAESIGQFTGRFMRRNGMDRVSVVVPDKAGEDGRFLIQNSANPDAIVQTITAYAPESLADTPLNEMMALAIDHAAQNENGRYQAILLFTDGGRIHRQLAFDALVEGAQAINLPVFAAILGARADPNEIDAVIRLTEPTGAAYVHMPAATDTDAIYLAWQGQANQTWLVYRSLQTKSGRYPITVSLGGVRDRTELALTLAAPEVALQLPETEIRRVGRAHDSPLAALEPLKYTVPVIVTWPDGLPREVTAASLLVNGQPAATANAQPDEDGRLTFDWDIQALESGLYQLAVRLADGLGYTAESAPLPITIVEERPNPPTPPPPPTPAPDIAAPEPTPAVPTELLWLALGLSLLIGAATAFLLWRRWRQRREALAGQEDAIRETAVPEPQPDLTLDTVAYLETEVFDTFPLTGENIIIGRDETVAQIVLSDDSVARLHARIRRRDGRYWLYDEGSAGGTTLNFERLGLSPQPLQDGDQIQMGRLRLRFRLGEPAQPEEPSGESLPHPE